MANIAVAWTVQTVLNNPYMGAMVGGDTPLQRAPYKSVSGHVYDVNRAPVVGATVVLFRQVDNLRVDQTTTGALGLYSFTRSGTDMNIYYTVAYSVAGGSVQIHGVSDRGLVAA